jgi:hypothetical protein
MSGAKEKIVNFRCDDAFEDELIKAAGKWDMGKSEFIRTAIIFFMSLPPDRDNMHEIAKAFRKMSVILEKV